ncbi:hypothetical protein [Flavobacterium terrisoli]|uniref:hypothetical protein n=1 Tax=Flavobacterium terrisoli TaxID=3242195 RepID=UPI002542D56E|nr:hypothetical protein [Flavobacterium buctense]
MKKLFLALIFSSLFLSCSSDDSSGPPLSDTPDAKVQYDDSSFGIYKGVFVGSSGTVFIDVYNGETATATLTINGSSKTYTAAEKVAEDFDIVGLTFTNGSNSFDFSVNGDGSNPTVSNINISGHANARMAILKEFHNSLCRCYVGTYSGDDSGVLNVVIEGSIVDGWAKSDEGNSVFNCDGTFGGSALWGTFEGGSFSGQMNGNTISGGWSNDASESGGWQAKRKL